MKYMPILTLVRHGESLWNKENRFTGWTDIDLSKTGEEEAKSAGQKLLREGVTYDIAYTSYLTRAIRTLHIILEETNRLWIPEEKSWRLNERHYGALQGLNKAEILEKVGEEQFKKWRRSFDIPPPALEMSDERFPGNDPRYKGVDPKYLPKTESLKDTYDRVIPYLESNIKKSIQEGKNVIVSAHGNSLRAVVKYLENISDSDIPNLEIPTGIPYIYTVDNNCTVISKKILT